MMDSYQYRLVPIVIKEAQVKSFWLVLLLSAFILSCRSNDQMPQVKTATQTREVARKTHRATSGGSQTLSGQNEKKSHESSGIEKKSVPEAGKQKDTKLQQEAKPPEVLKKLIEIVERQKAAEKELSSAEEELMLGITGLIIEQTMTKIGYDFYEYFFLLWEAPEGIPVKDYNIYINERASPLWGSWVQVGVNETVVWSRVLRPRSTEIEDAAKEAIDATTQYLVNYEQYQFKTDDMVGTGI